MTPGRPRAKRWVTFLRMRRISLLLAGLVLLPLPLACGGDSSYDPPDEKPIIVDRDEQRRKKEAAEKREAGKRLQEGDGYWYVRPKAWENRTRGYQDVIPFLDDAISDRVEREIFAQVMFTTILPANPYLNEPLEDQQAEFGRHLRSVATDVERHKLTTVDRKDAVHHSGIARGGAYRAQLDQFVVISERKLYTITFKLDLDNPAKSRKKLIRDVLESWHWAD